MTVTEVKGYGRQKGHAEIYRGMEYAVHFLPKLKLEWLSQMTGSTRLARQSTKAPLPGALATARFVLDLEAVTRIRTGETDAAAL